MARATFIFIFFLSLICVFLLGINVGKKIQQTQFAPTPQPTTTPPTPTLQPPTATPTAGFVSPTKKPSANTSGTSTYTNRSCGFTFSYPGSYLNQKSVNEYSLILTEPDNEKSVIATTCAEKLPRPPVSSDKIESISLDGVAAILYHDQNEDGSPRDEVIVKHPQRNLEIIIAGYGETFQAVLTSFRFL